MFKTGHIVHKIRYSLSVVAHIFGRNEIKKNCPCCGYVGQFDTVGHPPRYGSLCPACSSLERHRLFILASQNEDFFTDKEVLHFAPEAILSLVIGTRAKRYVTADIETGRAEWVLNIEQIDQPDESWDVVICSHVLEHVDDQAALKELYRILRKESLLLVMVPMIEGWESTYENPEITAENDRRYHFGQYDHVRYYGSDIRTRLKKAGFDLCEYTADGSDSVKYGLMRGEKIFVCTKHDKVS